MAHPLTPQRAGQASQKDRDYHRKPPNGGPARAATCAEHQSRREIARSNNA